MKSGEEEFTSYISMNHDATAIRDHRAFGHLCSPPTSYDFIWTKSRSHAIYTKFYYFFSCIFPRTTLPDRHRRVRWGLKLRYELWSDSRFLFSTRLYRAEPWARFDWRLFHKLQYRVLENIYTRYSAVHRYCIKRSFFSRRETCLQKCAKYTFYLRSPDVKDAYYRYGESNWNTRVIFPIHYDRLMRLYAVSPAPNGFPWKISSTNVYNTKLERACRQISACRFYVSQAFPGLANRKTLSFFIHANSPVCLCADRNLNLETRAFEAFHRDFNYDI